MDIKEEKRYSIDPGKGRKMDGCPYSNFEDGQDVKEYIIPPKGYVFKGFRFDPDASNQIYDGKLIAEYEKEPFKLILKSNLWKVVLAVVIIAVITGVTLLAVSVFKDPKSSQPKKDPKTNEQVVDTPHKDKAKDKTNKDKTSTDIVNGSTATTAKEDPKANIAEQVEEPKQTQVAPQPDPNDPNAQFNARFWKLIHQCEMKMDPYDSLYKDNRNKVSGEEYDYLRFTILENYSSFQTWTKQLKQVPPSELESINTIESLKQKLNATH